MVTPAGEPATLFDPDTGSPVDTAFTLAGHGRPYLLNAWTGQITPIATYTSTNDTVTVHVSLPADGSEIVAVTPDGARFVNPPVAGRASDGLHVISTTADEAVVNADGKLAIRASQPGTYTTRLSNGRTITTTITSGVAAIDLTNHDWQLRARQ